MSEISWHLETIIFMALALTAVAFLLLSLFLGELFEVFHLDLDFPGHDLFDAGDHGDGAPILNLKVILGFIAGFGAIGWVLSGYVGVSFLGTLLAAFGAGIIFAGILAPLIAYLQSQGRSEVFRLEDLVGEQATVTSRIPVQGIGEVQYLKNGATHTALARCEQIVSIAQGALVKIEQVREGVFYVREEEQNNSSTSTSESIKEEEKIWVS